MAATRDTTAKNIKPLTGAIIRRHTSGAAIAAGECVGLSDDGFVDPCDMTSAVDQAIGVAIQAASGAAEEIDVVVYGPVKCITGGTIGATVFNTTSAGEYTQTDSGDTTAVGYAESATVLFVQPEHLA